MAYYAFLCMAVPINTGTKTEILYLQKIINTSDIQITK